MPLIDLSAVSFLYNGTIKALSDINISVSEGDFLVILGPNGSGKTTLLGIMSGVLKPSGGRALLEGKAFSSLDRKEIARTIAYVPQHIQVDFPFTVREVVLMGRFAHLKGLGIEGKADMEIADEAMEMTGVAHLADRLIHQLSGGERQRVFIAQAITAEPKILMLDEPISSLDIKYQSQMMKLAQSLNNKGITIVATIHDLNYAGMYAKNIILLKKGIISASGAPKDMLNRDIIRQVFDVEVTTIERDNGSAPFIFAQ
ncbi:MAG: ABC transporter ATP-binding protein [Firmicutes bacterium]|nr:ABC transporter ATP-binding protein [Bacillota bacterium]